jgi:hypothetical protein
LLCSTNEFCKIRRKSTSRQVLQWLYAMVSFKISFDSKLEPKLVSALSETKHLFRLFRLCTETESFDVSIEPKQTEDQPKQFDREHILLFFTEHLGFFRFFPVFLVSSDFFRFVTVVLLLYRNREFRCFDWTETNRRPTQTVQNRVYLGIF